MERIAKNSWVAICGTAVAMLIGIGGLVIQAGELTRQMKVDHDTIIHMDQEGSRAFQSHEKSDHVWEVVVDDHLKRNDTAIDKLVVIQQQQQITQAQLTDQIGELARKIDDLKAAMQRRDWGGNTTQGRNAKEP